MIEPKSLHNNYKISIVGSGKVARALANAFSKTGIILTDIICRFPINTADTSETSFFENAFDLEKDFTIEGIYFLAVSDDAIQEVAQKIVNKKNTGDVFLVHCSGASDLTVLANKNSSLKGIASFHPIQTIQHGADLSIFSNVGISILSENSDLEKTLFQIAKLIGAKPFKVNPKQKQLLHLAAVFASNYFNTLIHQLHKFDTALGLKDAHIIDILKPIISQTADVIIGNGTHSTLTGPISRGDSETIRNHLKLLEELPHQLTELYILMGQLASDQALEANQIDENHYSKLISALKNDQEE